MQSLRHKFGKEKYLIVIKNQEMRKQMKTVTAHVARPRWKIHFLLKQPSLKNVLV